MRILFITWYFLKGLLLEKKKNLRLREKVTALLLGKKENGARRKNSRLAPHN